MKTITQLAIAIPCIITLLGCSTQHAPLGGSAEPPHAPAPVTTAVSPEAVPPQPGRMLIWKADLGIQVASVSNAIREATLLTERLGGFVGQTSGTEDNSARLTLRIPAKSLTAAITGLEALGTTTHKNMEGTDVTDQYIDVEARLKNRIALRDRLKQLLDKATTIKDILAIEAELNRIQGDIDSMEGRIQSLKGQADYATIMLTLKKTPPQEKKRILGPLGYLLKGLFWSIGKLFVIRE